MIQIRGLYLFVAGLIFGAFIGWMFHNVIGAAFQLLFFIAVLTPIVLILLFWRKSNRPAKSQVDDIPDARWSEIDPQRSRR